MNKYIILILLASSLFGLDFNVIDRDKNSVTIRLDIPEPTTLVKEMGERIVEIPRWWDATLAYDPVAESIVSVFSTPILLPPSGNHPALQVLSTESQPDRRLSDMRITAEDIERGTPLPEINSTAWIDLATAENFRSIKTARIRIFPYAVSGQRLQSMTFRLVFTSSVGHQATADGELVNSFLNAHMAGNWSQARPGRLNKTATTLPQGQWYKIPINTTGVYKITASSFGGSVPESSPLNWQVYAPYYEGRSLPFSLSTAPTPDNLVAISISTKGIQDNQFSDDDEISFFAYALNGDFKGSSFTHSYGTQRYYWLCIPEGGSTTTRLVTPLTSSEQGPATHTIASYEKRFLHENELHNQLHSGVSWVGEKLNGNADQFSLVFNDDYLDFTSEINLSTYLVVDYDAGGHLHRLDVELNGLPFNVYQNNTAAYKKIILTGTAGENMMQDGNNTLTLNYSSSSNASIIYLDSLRLTYSRQLAPSADYLLGTVQLPDAINRLVFTDIPDDFTVWDISDQTAVAEWQIDNNQFLIAKEGNREIIGFSPHQVQEVTLELVANNLGASQIRTADMQADYIIITPEVFLEQAQRIKTLRESQVAVEDQLNVEIVLIDDIYNEFSAGTQDPAAIKHFLHYVYFSWQTPQLRYVLFLGDTDYDFRNITGQSKMLIPTYQKDGTNDVSSYPTDDRYTFIASGIHDALPDLAIGRLPAQSSDQLEIMVDKIINYELTPEPGIWSNTVTLVADDPLRPTKFVEYYHIHDTEGLASILPNTMHVNKVYLTEYPEVQDPNSPYIKKPKARDAFLQKLYDGTLLINYLGHGSPHVWAQEEVFTSSDLSQVKTGLRLPFWVAGTCDWAKYDDVNTVCVPEELMLMESNGAVGIFSTTRKTYGDSNEFLISQFYNYLFPDDEAGRSIRVGDAAMLAKNVAAGSDTNNEKYVLFSDPALRLASPNLKGKIETLTPSVFMAMGNVSYSGKTDTVLADNARAAVTVYDTPTPVTRAFYISSSGNTGHISYVLPGKRLFRGLISVNDRDFSGGFTLPKDIKYAGRGGVLRVQYWDETGLDGSIYLDTLNFMGTDSTALDDTGPEILFISDNMVLLNGDHFSANEPLEVELRDDQGINLTGAAGHGITLAIDEDWDNAYDVTELFEYDLDHSDRGRLSAFLTEITPGEHLITVKAWDSQNNPNEASVRLEFFAANDFRIYDLFNYPNPMANETEITFMLSHQADIDFAIYTLSGRKISKGSLGYLNQGFNSFPWDGHDSAGNQLANGVYIVVIEADNNDYGEPAQSLQKLVIAR